MRRTLFLYFRRLDPLVYLSAAHALSAAGCALWLLVSPALLPLYVGCPALRLLPVMVLLAAAVLLWVVLRRPLLRE